MFKRRAKAAEPEEEDAIPDSIAPWEMLDSDETLTAQIQTCFPHFVAIARRLDEDTVACFDKKEDGTGKEIVILTDASEPDKTTQRRLSGFGEWFDEAARDAKKYKDKR